MRSPFRHILPFGVVRASQLASELIRLGVPPSGAWRRAVQPDTAVRLQRLNLNLLPDHALSGIDCLVDIGANVGDWTAEMLEFCRPGRLFCIEPDPLLAGGLQARFAHRPEVSVLQAAIGATPGSAEFTLMRDSVLNSLRQPTESMKTNYAHVDERERIQVQVIPLDAVIPPDTGIRILKIDVQGFEREVLAGAAQTLRRTDYVLMEVNFQPHYEGEAGFFELDAIMQQHGFCIGNYSRPKGGRRQALYADVLYLRKDS